MLPKLIHQIVGKKPSQLVQACLESWKSTISHGFKIIYWDDPALEEFINLYYGFAKKAFTNARNHAEAADIARYLLVYHYGGYYVDWDTRLNHLDSFLKLSSDKSLGYFIVDPINGTLASEYFCSSVRNPYLLGIVKDIVATYERDERELMHTPQYSGPYRMKAVIRKYKNLPQAIIPVKDVFEYSYHEIRKQKKYGEKGIVTHFWEHSWIT